jgi:glycine/D-amino acid oxidase-like deaminating enzyme
VNGERSVVVVGAGVLGLLSAVACVARGVPVVVLDRGPIPNPEATSFDEHRMLRACHPHDVAATRRARLAARRWTALEGLLGERLFHRTGALTALAVDAVEPARAVLGAAGEPLTRAQVRRRWPHLHLPTPAALFEPGGGVLLADRVLRALAAWLAAHPLARLVPHAEATGVDAEHGVVEAGGATWRGHLLLTAGVRTSELVPGVDVRLYRQSVLYCRVPDAHRAAFADLPAVPLLAPATGGWLVPPVAGTRLKLSTATACHAVDEVADRTTAPLDRATIVAAFTGPLAGFSGDWVVEARDCYYAAGPGGGPLAVDLAPGAVAHPACGGTSFKFAPLVADELVDRLLTGAPRGERV